MTRRYEGFVLGSALLVLDTFTGEVRRIAEPSADPDAGDTAATSLPPALAQLAQGSTTVPAKPQTVVEENTADPFDREVALTYPYPIARAWSALLAESDPRMQCKLMVDTFTAVLKMLALQVASEYLHATDVRSPQVNQTLARDLRRPLISAWNLVLQRTLPALRDAGVTLFAPEVEQAYRTLETKCRERFLVTTTYEDASGETRSRTKKLGKIQALISYRNSLAHGFNQSRARAQREVDTYLPLLREILRETRFLARYELWHVRTTEGRAEGMRLHGATPTGGFSPIDPVDLDPTISPLFLRHPSTGDTLPLFAFFDVDTVEEGGLPGMGKDVLLFEGNTKRTVIYVSASGEHVEKASRLAHWRALLARKALDVALLTADSLTREALSAAAGRVSAGSVEALVQSGKYLREATIDRACLAETLSRFEAGQRTGLVVGGSSGIGKSSFIARCVDRWQETGHVVAFYRASTLSRPEVGQRLLRDLGVSNSLPYLEEFLAAAAPLFAETDHRFLLVVDAVNEFPGEVPALVRELDALIHQAQHHPWFRVVASVREGTQRRLPPDARFGARGLGPYVTVDEVVDGETRPVPVARLQPVTEDEVAALYDAYRSYRVVDPDDPDDPGVASFCPQTAFAELDPKGHTRTLLREPLMARLVMAAHHRRALPGNLRVDAAMKLYLETAVVEAGTAGGGFPDRQRFLQRLVKELDRASTDSLPRDALAAMPGLRPLFGSFQRDSPYIQLLELGVLLEEWRDDECYVRFAFDRMLEHLLAERLDPRVQSAADALALAERALAFPSLRGVLGVILARACDEGRARLVTELLDATDGAEVPVAVADLVTATVTDLVVRLGIDGAPGLSSLLATLQETPSAADVEMLCAAADDLSRLGVVAALESVLEALDAESKSLGESGPRAKAALRLAARANMIGDRHRTTRLLQEVLDHTSPEQGFRQQVQARGLLGVLAHNRGDWAEAETTINLALKHARDSGFRDLEALNIHRLGHIVRLQGNYDKAESLLQASLAIKEELGDNAGIGISYGQLGTLAKNRGDHEEADRLYRASLAIKQELGDKSGIGEAYSRLGTLAAARGHEEEARALLQTALDMQADIGDASGSAMTRFNLACLAWECFDFEDARDLWLEGIREGQALQKPDHELEAYCKLAMLSLDPPDDSVSQIARLLQTVDTPRNRLLASSAQLCLAARETESGNVLQPLLSQVREASNAMPGTPHIEDSAAPGLWMAARALSRLGDVEQARQVAMEAEAIAAGRRWPHAAELAAFLQGSSQADTALPTT